MEGDRTMLDNSVVLWTSEFSEAAKHLVYNQPVLLAGGASGNLRTGLHHEMNAAEADSASLAYDTQYSTHNLYTTLLQAFGQSDDHFGDDTAPLRGPIPGMLA